MDVVLWLLNHAWIVAALAAALLVVWLVWSFRTEIGAGVSQVGESLKHHAEQLIYYDTLPITYTEYFLIGMVVISVLVAIFTWWEFGAIMLGLAGLLAYRAAKPISPANPPQVAVPTLWGRRLCKVIGPRWVFVLKDFPFVEELILIDSSKQELVITIEGVRCRAKEPVDGEIGDAAQAQSGGAVTVTYGVTFEPSIEPPQRLHDYIDAGEKEGVQTILKSIVDGATREEGSNHTWEHLTFTKAELSAKIIALTTGQPPTHKVLRGDEGKPLRDTSDSAHAYQTEAAEPDAKLDEIDYQNFLQRVLVNGYNDVMKLGIRLRRLNVIEIMPEGELKGDAERVAREQQQQRAEKIDIETAAMLAKIFMDKANEGLSKDDPGWMTFAEALEQVQTERGRASKVIIKGSKGEFTDAAGVLRATPPTTKKPDTTKAVEGTSA